ncbi:MAG: DUF4350 domain-containing protein [Candidatus Altiarchaeota archaeon]
MKSRLYFFLALILCLALFIANCSAKVVLFYETGKISGQYKIDSGYKEFKKALEKRGYTVSKVEIELSKAVLQRYDPDVLVIAGLSSPLTPQEQAAVFEFVMQDGRGLFICGGTPAANQLSIPFGMTIDDAPLEDEVHPIRDYSTGQVIADKSKFSLTLSNIITDPVTKSITQGVSQLGFFGGNGIALSGNAKAILIGYQDTYAPKSSTGLFPKGSKPPVAAYSIVGNGLVFLLSDASMLLDSNLDPSRYRHDNLRFGTNIVEWLSIKREQTVNASLDELYVIIGDLKLRLNETLEESAKKDTLISELTNDKNTLAAQLDNCNKELEKLKSEKFMGVSHWIIAVGFLGFAILVASAIYAKKAKTKKEEAHELGYEFEEKEEEKGELNIGGGKFDDFLEEKTEKGKKE